METATNIIVTGLPVDIRFTKLLNKFRALFRRINIKMFWIRNTTETEGSQHATIELMSLDEAKKARNFLNSQAFIFEMVEYPMEAYLEDKGGDYRYEANERRPRPRKRNRPRSRSPGYSQEASKLDMEIELLRKQRLVIEEERRLLLEQKKLEMIREYGPGAAREFDKFDHYEPPRKKRQPEPVSKKPRQRSPHQAPHFIRPNALPAFFQPCKQLIAKMKPYIEKDTTPEEVAILIKLIRAAIRKRLALALEGKAYLRTADILKLYREKHPEQDDEAFVRKILGNIRASYLTNDVKVDKKETPKVIKKEKVSDVEADDAKGNANEKNVADTNTVENDKNDTKEDKTEKGDDNGDKVAINEIAPKDTADGENETDVTAPNATVKTEPNTSQELENVSAGNLSEEVRIKTNDDTFGPDESAEKDVTAPDASQELENISAGNLSEEVKIKTNKDTLGTDETADEAVEDALAEGTDNDWTDWNTEETKAQ